MAPANDASTTGARIEMSALTHLSSKGEAHIVDVSDKAETKRVAIARGRIVMDAGDARSRRRGTGEEGRCVRRRAHRRHHGGEEDA